jgi:CHASE3 domain sensor protein
MSTAQRLERNTLIGYALIFAILIAGGALGVRNVIVLRKTEAAVAHTHEVLGAIETLMSTVKDAETGHRGFLLVKDDSYLEPYTTAMASVARARSNLATLVADHPLQTQRLAAVLPIVTRRLDVLNDGVALVRAGNDSAALTLLRTDRGKRLMDSIRANLNAMAVTERELLQQRSAEARVSRSFALGSMIVSGIIGALLIGAVALVTARRLREQLALDSIIAEQAERMRTTLSSIGDAVIVTDTAGRIESMNGVAELLTGWTIDSARGVPLVDVFRIVNEDSRGKSG